MTDIDIDGQGQTIHVNLLASEETNIGHLNFNCKGEATILIHLSGKGNRTGLHITGTIDKNSIIGYGFVNELDPNSKLLRCEDWNVHRDSSLEYGESYHFSGTKNLPSGNQFILYPKNHSIIKANQG